MTKITLNAQTYEIQPGDSVLDTLIAHHVDIPYACQQGICQSCLIRSPKQTPPSDAQIGLKETQRENNYFLACQCHPYEDLELELDTSAHPFFKAHVIGSNRLSEDVIELVLLHPDDFEFKAGQFVNLRRDDGLVRSYSIANLQNDGNTIELHIRKLANGQFSEWAHDTLQVGDSIEIQGPFGDCFYVCNNREEPLLLIGTGTGLAPLLGIIKDALAQGHTGPIHLYHGSRDFTGLYAVEELTALANNTSNFFYTPCLSAENTTETTPGRAHDVALAEINEFKDHKIYLCGHPNMVKETQRNAYLAGASLHRIFADAFTLSN